MEFDGDVLTIGLDMSMEEVREFEAFIRPRLEYLETIEVEEGSLLHSSALLALLVSIKRTRNEISIPFLDRGVISSETYGTVHWIHYD
jgi:hypothetical protein